MNFSEGQVLEYFARVMLSHAKIVSGSYKQWDGKRFNEDGSMRDMTDAEKLSEAIHVMEAHTRFLSECVESLPTKRG